MTKRSSIHIPILLLRGKFTDKNHKSVCSPRMKLSPSVCLPNSLCLAKLSPVFLFSYTQLVTSDEL